MICLEISSITLIVCSGFCVGCMLTILYNELVLTYRGIFLCIFGLLTFKFKLLSFAMDKTYFRILVMIYRK